MGCGSSTPQQQKGAELSTSASSPRQSERTTRPERKTIRMRWSEWINARGSKAAALDEEDHDFAASLGAGGNAADVSAPAPTSTGEETFRQDV